jgi:pimeloyl-ACP methyl ester carboxylesterase
MFRSVLMALTVLLMAGPALSQSEPKGDRVEVNGMQMYYEVSGQGDPLIVLHGAYMNIPSMGAVIPKLAETHKVYAIEFQGHGRTTDIDRPITFPIWRTMSLCSWTRWESRRPMFSATPWVLPRASNSPFVIRRR